jgi:hypothetical protein
LIKSNYSRQRSPSRQHLLAIEKHGPVSGTETSSLSARQNIDPQEMKADAKASL